MEKEFLEALLESCERELRGEAGAASAFILKSFCGDQMSMIRDVRNMFLGNPMQMLLGDEDVRDIHERFSG